jgi:plastocyanin
MTSSNVTTSGNTTGNMTSGNMTATSGNQSSASGNNVKVVSGASTLLDKAFDPNPVTVSKGTTVTWTNDDTQLHTITSGSMNAPDKGKLFDSGYKFAPGTKFSHMFDTTGSFDYFCQLHPSMVGKVVVN